MDAIIPSNLIGCQSIWLSFTDTINPANPLDCQSIWLSFTGIITPTKSFDCQSMHLSNSYYYYFLYFLHHISNTQQLKNKILKWYLISMRCGALSYCLSFNRDSLMPLWYHNLSYTNKNLIIIAHSTRTENSISTSHSLHILNLINKRNFLWSTHTYTLIHSNFILITSIIYVLYQEQF